MIDRATRFWRRLAIVLFLLMLDVLFWAPAQSQTKPPIFNVSVEGRVIAPDDLADLSVAVVRVAPKLTTVTANRSTMPSTARLVWYNGKDPHDLHKGILLVASDADASTNAFREEYNEALVLAALDQGRGGPTLQSLFNAKSDATSRSNLASAVMRAWRSASEQLVTSSQREQVWLKEHITLGTSRAQIFAIAAGQGLHAYSWDYGGRVQPPVVIIELPGAFEPGCSYHTDVIARFDVNERVKEVNDKANIASCL